MARDTTSKKAEMEQRRAIVWRLYMDGHNKSQIARLVDVSEATIRRDVKAVLGRLEKNNEKVASDYRQIMNERIGIARQSIAQAVRSGNMYALDRWIRLNEQEIKLNGLDKSSQLPREIVELLPAMLRAFEAHNLNASDVFEAMIRELHSKEVE